VNDLTESLLAALLSSGGVVACLALLEWASRRVEAAERRFRDALRRLQTPAERRARWE
jgi:hypothetical protein